MGVGKIPLKQLVNDSSMDFSTTKCANNANELIQKKNNTKFAKGFILKLAREKNCKVFLGHQESPITQKLVSKWNIP